VKYFFFLVTLVILAFSSTVFAQELDFDKKYLFQRSDNHESCGPIALVNAAKSLNYKFDEVKWHDYLYKKMQIKKNIGSTLQNLHYGAYLITKKTPITIASTIVYDTTQLERVGPKRAIVFTGFYKDKKNKIRGHSFVINYYDAQTGQFRVVNYSSQNKQHVRFVKMKDLDFYFKLKDLYPVAIILEKKD